MEEKWLENICIKNALDYLCRDDERTLQEQLTMCEIPAPSGMEEKKGAYVRKQFEEIGLEDVRVDEAGNVLGRIRGSANGPTIMLAAHLDTVFPIETDVRVKKVGNVYCCPGINDDTRGVAEMLSVARAMKAGDLQLTGDLIFCANVCEEGLGDLKGVKHLFSGGRKIDAFVSIDNQITGGIVYTATGSNRYEVTFLGEGGHSFGDFGIPNPIHALGRLVAKVSDFQVPEEPKTTFNVGVIQGGTSVNTIAQSATLLMDMRSDSPEELEHLTERFLKAVDESVAEENGRWDAGKRIWAEIVQKGKRPAGSQSKDCVIVECAWEAARLLGIEPELRHESSTDANIPISLGIPAVTVGRGGREGRMHTLEEWFEPVESYLGPQRDLLLLVMLGGVTGVISPRITLT